MQSLYKSFKFGRQHLLKYYIYSITYCWTKSKGLANLSEVVLLNFSSNRSLYTEGNPAVQLTV